MYSVIIIVVKTVIFWWYIWGYLYEHILLIYPIDFIHNFFTLTSLQQMTCNRNIIHNVGHIKLAGRSTLKNRTLHQRRNHFPNGKSFPPLPLIHITHWPANMIDSDQIMHWPHRFRRKASTTQISDPQTQADQPYKPNPDGGWWCGNLKYYK